MKLSIDLKKLYQVLEEFHTLTGLKVSLLENSERTIASFPSDICALCKEKQKDPAFLKKCKANDQVAVEIAAKTTETYIYECHYHLVEAIQSIRILGQPLGYLMIGQMLQNRNKFIEQNNPSPAEIKLLERLPKLSSKKIKAATNLFSWLAEYLLLNKDMFLEYRNNFQVIADYIAENLTESITVDSLCRGFNYSRTALFSLFQSECAMGVIEYVNHIRLEKSKTLLKSYKINETAQLVGIPDANYFSRAFKKKYHISPMNFIKFKS